MTINIKTTVKANEVICWSLERDFGISIWSWTKEHTVGFQPLPIELHIAQVLKLTVVTHHYPVK